MYVYFKKLKRLEIYNENFKLNLQHSATKFNLGPSNLGIISPFKLKLDLNSLTPSFQLDDNLFALNDIPYVVLNEFTISYLTTGTFEDSFNEFFIKNHNLDYGMVPPFISKKLAETIAYIGKYTAFLRSISSKETSNTMAYSTMTHYSMVHNNMKHPLEILPIINSIDLSKKSIFFKLKSILKFVNFNLKVLFFEKKNIFLLLEFIHSTFLFGRVDFIENLFNSLKESQKAGKKNILNILENSLNFSFKNGQFNNLMDIYITNSNANNSNGSEDSGFSLYIKLDYPVSLLIEEDFVVKLVYIFKFLWKIKKIDHLSRRVGNLKLILFSQKLMFYAFNEVIGQFKLKEFDSDAFLFDDFKRNLNGWIDSIMSGLFINTKGKKIEHLLFNLEKYLIKMGRCKGRAVGLENMVKVDVLEDKDRATALEDLAVVMRCMKEFYEFAESSLEGTTLFNLRDFYN